MECFLVRALMDGKHNKEAHGGFFIRSHMETNFRRTLLEGYSGKDSHG